MYWNSYYQLNVMSTEHELRLRRLERMAQLGLFGHRRGTAPSRLRRISARFLLRLVLLLWTESNASARRAQPPIGS